MLPPGRVDKVKVRPLCAVDMLSVKAFFDSEASIFENRDGGES